MHLPKANNDKLTHAFTFGLKADIHTQVLLSKPDNLNEAMNAAPDTDDLKYGTSF